MGGPGDLGGGEEGRVRRGPVGCGLYCLMAGEWCAHLRIPGHTPSLAANTGTHPMIHPCLSDEAADGQQLLLTGKGCFPCSAATCWLPLRSLAQQPHLFDHVSRRSRGYWAGESDGIAKAPCSYGQRVADCPPLEHAPLAPLCPAPPPSPSPPPFSLLSSSTAQMSLS